MTTEREPVDEALSEDTLPSGDALPVDAVPSEDTLPSGTVPEPAELTEDEVGGADIDEGESGEADSRAAEADADADAEAGDVSIDARIASAGGTVVGEASLSRAVPSSQVRRAPLYKRFALLGGIIGLVAAIVGTPFAMTDQFVGRGTIFLVMAAILIPLGILLACIVAVASDKAARKPARVRSQKTR